MRIVGPAVYVPAMTGAKQVMVGQDHGSKRLVDIAQAEGVTFSAGVPTVLAWRS